MKKIFKALAYISQMFLVRKQIVIESIQFSAMTLRRNCVKMYKEFKSNTFNRSVVYSKHVSNYSIVHHTYFTIC